MANLIFLLIGVFSLGKFAHSQANFNTTAGFVAEKYASVPYPRKLVFDDAGDILVISDQVSRITAVYEENGVVRTALLLDDLSLELTHGIAYGKGFLYASSDVTVYRWAYTSGQRGLTGEAQVVIKNMPVSGHVARSMVFDKDDLFYVHTGSGTNVDPDSSRARIRRFNLSEGIPNGGIEFSTGEVFADGLRNEVGLAFDGDGILWGVQNGADELFREDLGGDIHQTNPADELTKYDKPLGTFYGYPYCWTVDQLEGHEQGEQFAWPDFLNDGIHTDAWCQNTSNNHPPTLPLPAHYAALDIAFYDGANCDSSPGAFPCSMKGDAFVNFHGSWNRDPPAGYKVVHIPINPQTKLPTGKILDIMYEPDAANCGRCFRPVSLTFNSNGHLIVTADASSELFRIKYVS